MKSHICKRQRSYLVHVAYTVSHFDTLFVCYLISTNREGMAFVELPFSLWTVDIFTATALEDVFNLF